MKHLSILLLASTSLVALVGLFGFAVSSLSAPPYPGAIHISTRLPAVRAQLNDDCFAVMLVNKSYYTVPDKQVPVIDWFKANDWMENYRYPDSVLRQNRRRFGALDAATVREIFVENQSMGAQLVWTTQTTLRAGDCE